MLFEVLQKVFVADQWLVYALLESSQILLVLLESLPDCIVYQIGERTSAVNGFQP
jgi:hypothetical protein